MIVLALDTATASSAVALRLADGSTLQARDDPPTDAHPGHATRLLDLARGLIEQAGLGWSELDRIGVGVGPGTFTGLRVGIATARGLAQSLDVELVGVSSLQALAEGAFSRAERPADSVLAVIDARRGEVFAAAYEHVEGQPPRELSPPQALAPARVTEVLAHAGQHGAGSGRRWLALGDGAVRYREAIEHAGVPAPEPDSDLHHVSAAAVCSLALVAPVGARALLPDYRRRPDAELALEGAGRGRES
jgi:tRNA threonylcarbamoyladenosine biosynthesis protein TsaB